MNARRRLGALVPAAVIVLAGCGDSSADSPGTEHAERSTSVSDPPEDVRTVWGWRLPERGFCQELLAGVGGGWWNGEEDHFSYPDRAVVSCAAFEGEDKRSAYVAEVVVGDGARQEFDHWLAEYADGHPYVSHPTITEVRGWQEGQRHLSSPAVSRVGAAQIVYGDGLGVHVYLRHGTVDLLPAKARDALTKRLRTESADIVRAVVEQAADTLAE